MRKLINAFTLDAPRIEDQWPAILYAFHSCNRWSGFVRKKSPISDSLPAAPFESKNK